MKNINDIIEDFKKENYNNDVYILENKITFFKYNLDYETSKSLHILNNIFKRSEEIKFNDILYKIKSFDIDYHYTHMDINIELNILKKTY